MISSLDQRRPPASALRLLSLTSWRKLASVLTRAERRQLWLILGGLLLTGAIDLLGVTSILPFMAIVAKPQYVHDVQYLALAYEWSGAATINDFLFILGIGCLLTVVISNAATFLVQAAILKFSFEVSRELSLRVLSGFLGQPYAFFLGRNGADLLVITLGEVEGVVNGVLIPGLQALSKLVAASFILAFVLAVDPLLAVMFLAIFGGAYAAIFLLTRRRISLYGETSQTERRSLFAVASEAFGSIKELKLLGREGFYFGRFAESSGRLRSHQVKYNVISAVPRYIIEAAAFGAIVFVVLFMLKTGRDVQSAIPLLVLYAFTGYRLMPAFQALYQNLTIVRFNWPSVELLADEVRRIGATGPVAFPERATTLPLAFRESIALKDVSFTYPQTSKGALENVSLRIERQTTVGLVGETGAGKTTIADILLGILVPSSGALLIDGRPIDDGNRRAWQDNIGYVPQQGFLSDASIASNIAFGMSPSAIDMARVEAAARTAQLHDFVSGLPQGYGTIVGERGVRLSGGQRQRIAIARALYRDPAVLVFDEATSALDGLTEEAVVEAIRRLAHQKTIITIAHRLSTVRDCDVIYLLEHGRVADFGSYDELLSRNEKFRGMARYSDAGRATAPGAGPLAHQAGGANP
ncbi:ABC transporter ATP-binding protein [Bradyrhizobium symbiodeficiens]|uniref:ABC transporter ATP-binding protein n=1 Tax=Bradyrhizobium symbiodeficiens TaxID=1404367 RepID=UPI00140F6C91|nr:ABC transporter ATP-binding protein [Bradyrhizobium symbiodeficiens]QIP01742.1 ABC transporter ATP-binding protein [Bradyrhizobium symbiodeficiens]